MNVCAGVCAVFVHVRVCMCVREGERCRVSKRNRE